MGGRAAPNWIAFDGGPRDGQREIVYGWDAGARTFYIPAGAGLRTPHEYALTGERRRGGDRGRVWHRVARWVRSLPPEPDAPGARHVDLMAAWRGGAG